MMRKFMDGLVFGAGFAISFLVLWYVTSFWLTPMFMASRIDHPSHELSTEYPRETRDSATDVMGTVDKKPFHELPIDDQIKASSAIALARYEKSADGKMRAVIKEFLKKDPGTTIYYDVGDEYGPSSYYPKGNTSYGDGTVIFFTGSPATMTMSMTFSGDRIRGLGDLPIELFKKKCEQSSA